MAENGNNGTNGKTASKLVAALLGAVLALQSVFVGLLISHIQDRGIHNYQQSVSLDAYRADREHFQCSLEEIKDTLRDIQSRLQQSRAATDWPGPDSVNAKGCSFLSFPRTRESSLFALDSASSAE